VAPTSNTVASLSTISGAARWIDVCQDGAVHLPRTVLTALTAVLALSACASPGSAPQGAPQFVEPSASALATPSESASAAPSAPASAPASPSATPSRSPSKPAPSKSAAPVSTAPVKGVKYVFPVNASNVAFHPTHGKYPATDIFADCGKPAVATTSGVVLEVSLKDTYVKGSPDGPNNGGLSVSILGDDGVRYYGSHLSKVLSGIRAGTRVSAGQQLGKVGHTGNANNVCHLHFGISPPCAKTGDWKVRRGVVWPATFLTSWRGKGQKSPVATVAAWKKANNCKA
jgi:murein DD-endopeptidase MepM/ murein hydrolase activator NlpD